MKQKSFKAFYGSFCFLIEVRAFFWAKSRKGGHLTCEGNSFPEPESLFSFQSQGVGGMCPPGLLALNNLLSLLRGQVSLQREGSGEGRPLFR